MELAREDEHQDAAASQRDHKVFSALFSHAIHWKSNPIGTECPVTIQTDQEEGRMVPKRYRPDQDSGSHRKAFDRNKRKILATQTICGICGQPVDLSLRRPNPLAPTIDHIIPIAKGGHPSDIDNLQLAHWTCNRAKSDKLIAGTYSNEKFTVISNRNLPSTVDWIRYRG